MCQRRWGSQLAYLGNSPDQPQKTLSLYQKKRLKGWLNAQGKMTKSKTSRIYESIKYSVHQIWTLTQVRFSFIK